MKRWYGFLWMMSFASVALAAGGPGRVMGQPLGLTSGQPLVALAELQWVICEASVEAVFRKLSVQAGIASVRDVYYSETSSLDLLQHGAVLRSRVTKSKIKTAAKIRNWDETKIPWEFLSGKDSKCEVDAYLGKSSIACSVNSKPASELHLYSAEQALFLEKFAGFHDFASLKVFGPALSQEWQWQEAELGGDFVIEAVQAPKSFYSIELSVRVPRNELAAMQARVTAWLRDRDVVLCKNQAGKTLELLRALQP